MLIFGHTCLVFKDLVRTYFCEIYVILWDLIEIKKTKFLIPKYVTWPSAGRPDGRPRQKSIDRSGQPMCTNVHRSFGWRAGRPTRSTVREFCSMDLAPVDRAVDRQRASALCIQASVDRWHISQKSDRWPVDRVVDRQQNFFAVLAQGLDF